MRWTTSAAAGLLALGGLVALPAPSAVAYACSNNGNFFDAFTYDPLPSGHTLRGVSSYLVARPSSICSNPRVGDFSSSWSMWAGGAASNYVQAGFMKLVANGRTDQFAEENSGPGFHRVFAGGHSLDGDVVQFSVHYTSGDGCPSGVQRCAVSYRNGLLFQRTSFDPVTTWPPPFTAQHSAETSNSATDVPGSAAANTQFTGMQYFDGNGSAIKQPCNMKAVVDIPSRWDQATQACDQRSVWTK